MRKPKKYDIKLYPEKYQDRLKGYNQACDEWERFLPNSKEIEKIIKIYCESDYKGTIQQEIVKAISKRLKGKIRYW